MQIDVFNELIAQLIQFIASLQQSEYFPIAVALVAIILLIIGVWILGRFTKFVIKRSKTIPPEAKNGVSLIIGLFQLFIIGFGISFFFGVDTTTLISTSTIFATAIGFASTSIAANIVGGLYISLARPFSVGDLIKTQGTEGIVLEIGLNYTKLMSFDRTVLTIPNSILINTTLLNSNISVAEERERSEKAQKFKFRKVTIKIPSIITDGILYSLDQSELVRYVMKVELKLEGGKTVATTTESLDKVCESYKEIFGFPVSYYFGGMEFRLDTYFLITTRNVNTLVENYSAFLEAIVKAHYRELQEE
ncbi:MAG: mechanosensitive ion channel domain-containing protein [Promethearchaeota archaeon]